MAFMRGQLDRRIVVAYRVCAEELAAALPTSSQPLTHRGVGFVLTSLNCIKQWRPAFLPPEFGISIHRLLLTTPIERDGGDQARPKMHQLWKERCSEGSVHTLLRGNRLQISESLDHLEVSVESSAQTLFSLSAFLTPALPSSSAFRTLCEAKFVVDCEAVGEFELGQACCLPLHVDYLYNWIVDQSDCCPFDSMEFDSAFLVRREARRWKPAIQEAASNYRWQLSPVSALSNAALRRSRSAPSLGC